MSNVKFLFSRFGGYSFQFGHGKSSSLNLPEDQSFENVMGKIATKMNGYTYITSYEVQPEFMGTFEKLPLGYCTKVGDLEHIFLEALLTYDEYVITSIYFGKTKYSNVFSLFLKTDYKPIELALGKIEPSYDCVLYIRILNKTNEEIEQKESEIIITMLCLLIHHMGVMNTDFSFKPSKTHVGKKFNVGIFDSLINEIKSMKDESDLKNILELV